ncbi:hypothetical protein RDABS01_007425 [Bienertia sinuspersici]
MEPAKIDWQNIESIFILDQVYENINAPQWFDFLSSPSSSTAPDDVAWFCRSDCNHPRTAEDFLKSTPSKFLRSVSVSKLIADWTRREATNLKRRGNVLNEEEIENQNPNLSTPPNHNQNKHLNNKAGIKSSAEKKVDDDYSEIMLESDEKPKQLKATQSAKDLFGSKEIFGKITEFCSELKKMAVATKVKEREDEQETHTLNPNKPLSLKEDEKEEKGQKRAVLGPLSEKMSESDNKERKPLVQVKVDAGDNRSNSKGKLRKNKLIRRAEESENIPVSLDLNNLKREEKISPIRLNPPTPQGFSAIRDPFKTPSKAPKSKLMDMEKEAFQELNQAKTLKEELNEKSDNNNDNDRASLVAAKEGRTLDVFWFLKPCTLSS